MFNTQIPTSDSRKGPQVVAQVLGALGFPKTTSSHLVSGWAPIYPRGPRMSHVCQLVPFVDAMWLYGLWLKGVNGKLPLYGYALCIKLVILKMCDFPIKKDYCPWLRWVQLLWTLFPAYVCRGLIYTWNLHEHKSSQFERGMWKLSLSSFEIRHFKE